MWYELKSRDLSIVISQASKSSRVCPCKSDGDAIFTSCMQIPALRYAVIVGATCSMQHAWTGSRTDQMKPTLLFRTPHLTTVVESSNKDSTPSSKFIKANLHIGEPCWRLRSGGHVGAYVVRQPNYIEPKNLSYRRGGCSPQTNSAKRYSHSAMVSESTLDSSTHPCWSYSSC